MCHLPAATRSFCGDSSPLSDGARTRTPGSPSEDSTVVMPHSCLLRVLPSDGHTCFACAACLKCLQADSLPGMTPRQWRTEVRAPEPSPCLQRGRIREHNEDHLAPGGIRGRLGLSLRSVLTWLLYPSLSCFLSFHTGLSRSTFLKVTCSGAPGWLSHLRV